MSPLQNIVVTQAHEISKSSLTKFCMFHVFFVHIIKKDVVLNKLKLIILIVLHAIPTIPPKNMQARWRIRMPPNTTLIFFVQNMQIGRITLEHR